MKLKARGDRSNFWHLCDGFAEIKLHELDGRTPMARKGSDNVVKPPILQCADYARLHVSHKPFWLFSVGLLITGMKFRIMIVDHGGVQLSTMHSITGHSRR